MTDTMQAILKTEVDAYSLRDALTACLLSVGKDVTRPQVFLSIRIEKQGNLLAFMSTDSYRLTEATVTTVEASADDWSILLSTEDAKRVQSSIPKRNGRNLPLAANITVADDGLVTFTTRETQVRAYDVFGTLADGQRSFPKYDKLFLTETGEVAGIRFNPASMIDLCKMPGRDKLEPVHLEFVSELKAFASKWEGGGVRYRHLIMPVRPGR